MAIYTLHRRWRTGALALIEAGSPSQALERVARAGVSLAYADLKEIVAPRCSLPGADLRGADLEACSLAGAFLRSADLRTTSLIASDLRFSTLRDADLRRADLRMADLRQADLRNADLVGADLRDACATGARIDGARLDWRWSALVLELLRRDAGCRGDALRLVVDLAFDCDDRPYAWLEALVRRPGLLGWASSVLCRAIRPGDGAPEILLHLTEDESGVGGHRPAPLTDEPAESFYWTRSAHARMARRRGTA